jgi:hypothetical protein
MSGHSKNGGSFFSTWQWTSDGATSSRKASHHHHQKFLLLNGSIFPRSESEQVSLYPEATPCALLYTTKESNRIRGMLGSTLGFGAVGASMLDDLLPNERTCARVPGLL